MEVDLTCLAAAITAKVFSFSPRLANLKRTIFSQFEQGIAGYQIKHICQKI